MGLRFQRLLLVVVLTNQLAHTSELVNHQFFEYLDQEALSWIQGLKSILQFVDRVPVQH